MVEHAGLSERVSVEIGSVAERLPVMQRKYNFSGPLDAVLLDHEVSSYLPDLKLLEAEGLVTRGTTVLCDWSLYPGSDKKAPTDGHEFMEYLKNASGGTTSTSLRDKDVFSVSQWSGTI